MKKIRRINPFVIIIAIIITMVIVAISYQRQEPAGKTRDEISRFEERENQLVDDDLTKDEIADENGLETYEGWSTYNNDEYNVTFKYPSDWEQTESINRDADSLRVLVKKDQYEFDIYIAAGSPETCDFSSGNYEELSNEERVYRIQYQTEFNQYIVCMKDFETQTFVTWTDPGYIYYHVPKNPDMNYLEILNNILLSKTR